MNDITQNKQPDRVGFCHINSPINSHINLSKFYYEDIIIQDLLLKENYRSIMEIPCFTKIVCNNSSKLFASDKKNILSALIALEMITGQKAKITTAHKSIAGFKLRKDQPLGCTVTLRSKKMYSFLEKCLFLLLPIEHKGAKNKTLKSNFSLSNFPDLQEHFEFIKNIQVSFIPSSSKTLSPAKQIPLFSAFQLPF